MLDATEGTDRFDPAEQAAAIEACIDAAQACTACADACLAEEDVAAMRACIRRDLDCSDVCTATGRVLSRRNDGDELLVHRLLTACVRACVSCAEECDRHAGRHAHCAICADACRKCEHACRRLLETEAFEELQALAGG
jgi:hypothetical protein